VKFGSIADDGVFQFHLRGFQLSEKLRRLLVGGMWGRQILNATPLLKWYLEHGMVVTKIYQVMAYKRPPWATFA
jgi:hypothetical protein